jgi:hypothetical protein
LLFSALHSCDGTGAVAGESGIGLVVRGRVSPKEADVFTEQRPDAGKVGDVDCYRTFARVPEHIRCVVDVFEVKVLCEDSGDDLEPLVLSRRARLSRRYAGRQDLRRRCPC